MHGQAHLASHHVVHFPLCHEEAPDHSFFSDPMQLCKVHYIAIHVIVIFKDIAEHYNNCLALKRGKLSRCVVTLRLYGGEGSVLPSTNSPPDAGTPEGSSPSRRAQRSHLLYPLSGLHKHVHWSDREVPQAAS